MAEVIWTEPALLDLDGVAEYIALDNPSAASKYVQKVFFQVERLALFPNSGKKPEELYQTSYLEIVVPPCRIFYRVQNDIVYILYIMRAERLLHHYLLSQRDKGK